MLVIGIDVGGTSIKGAAINDSGKVFETFSLDVDKTLNGEQLITQLAELTKEYINTHNFDEPVVGIGMGIPGTMNTKTGVVVYSNNLCWYNLPVKDIMENITGLTVRITNDANAAALGETMFGSGKDYETCVMLTLGTGVGGGIVINGKLVEGNEGKGGELGHIVTVQGGRTCTCGRKGCLEAYASATGLVVTAKEFLAKNPNSEILTLVKNNIDKINGKVIFEAAKNGDEVANQIVDQYVVDLGEGLLNYCNILRPNGIILSGGVANAGEFLFEKLRKYLKENYYGYQGTPAVEVVTAALGYDSGKIGAASLFFDKN
jgi:glucokinase